MKRPLPFTKVQSIGNDFVLVEMADVEPAELPEIARITSDRHFSVGSDGLLAIAPDHGRLVLRMFNTDGSEDFCGNGLRCAALYGFQKGWTGAKAEICHYGQCVHTEVLDGGLVRSQFEPATFEPQCVPIVSPKEFFLTQIEVAGEVVVASAVSTGSTHTVVLSDKLPNDETFKRLGPAIENHPLFPQRTSVIWVVPSANSEDSWHTLRIRIWERGVGETMGCGTGSAAAAAVFLRALNQPKNNGFLPTSADSKQAPNTADSIVYDPQSESQNTTPPIYVINPGGMVQVYMKAEKAPIITSAVAEILYTAGY